MTQLRMDLADYVHELTQRHQHREHYTIRDRGTWYGRDHTTQVPPLLVQLAHADTPSAASEDGPRPGYGSKPAARLEALACLHDIEHDAETWLRMLGRPRDGRDLLALVRFLASLAPGLDPCAHRRPGCCDRHELEHDVRRWWTQARIITGWDSPPWRPDNTCPMCSERGTLRVNLAAQGAFCVECRETWDQSNIGLLADHIRAESAEEARPRPGRVACYCPISVMPSGLVARPVVAGLRLCPWCGSARCVHALEPARLKRSDEAS